MSENSRNSHNFQRSSSKNTATAPVQDSCPDWASEMISHLCQLEVMLGNLPPHAGWNSKHVSDLLRKTFQKEQLPLDESQSELLFSRIVTRLNKEGFSSTDVAGFINARMSNSLGLRYCDAAEVESALGQYEH